MQMKTSTLSVCLFLMAHSLSFSQVWTNAITGTNPSATSPYTTGDVTSPHISVSGIGRGSGIVADNADDRYCAKSWDTPSMDANGYFTFQMVKVSGSIDLDLTSFSYTGQASNGNGPSSFAVRSSMDAFATNLATLPAAGGTVILGAAFQNIPAVVEFRVYAWGTNSASGTFSINDFTFQGTAALPVELVEFKAETSIDVHTLKFTTASESNNSHFEIERSADSRNFIKIGEVEGAGTTSESHTYLFADQRPLKGMNYYRLRQVDFDGSSEMSKIVSLRFGNTQSIAVYPTLVIDQVNIELEEASDQDGNWQVFDLQGREILAGTLTAETTKCVGDLSQTPKGNYVLRMQVGNEVYTERIQKQ
jgi:hypothetical protein